MLNQAWNLVHIIVKEVEGGDRLANNQEGITIGTISGGIVNFGGAVTIAPISITRTVTGSGEENKGEDVTTKSLSNSFNQNSLTKIIDIIRRSL